MTSETRAPFMLRGGTREWVLAFTLEVATQKVRPLLRDVQNGLSTIFGQPIVRTVNGEPMIFVQGVRQDGEDHWLSRGETRHRMLAHTVAFLEKHNPPN